MRFGSCSTAPAPRCCCVPARSPPVPVSWLEPPPARLGLCDTPSPTLGGQLEQHQPSWVHGTTAGCSPARPWSLKLGSLPVQGMGRGLIEEMLTMVMLMMVMLMMVTMLMPHSAPSRLNEFTKHISGEGCKCARIHLRGGAGSASPPCHVLGHFGVPHGVPIG